MIAILFFALVTRVHCSEAIGECGGESKESCVPEASSLLQAKVEKVAYVASLEGPSQDITSAKQSVAKRAHKANGALRLANQKIAEVEKAFQDLEALLKGTGEALELGKGWWTRTVYGSVVNGKAPGDCWKSPVFGTCQSPTGDFLDGCCWKKDLPCNNDGCRPDSMDSTLKDPFGLHINKYAPFTIQQDCERTKGCNFYTCWIVGTQMQCKVYSEGVLVLGGDGNKDSQVSSCKGCRPETEQARAKRCGTKADGTCMSLVQMRSRCAKVDMQVHTDIEEVPQYHADNGGDMEQFNYAVYFSPEQLQCFGIAGWPQPNGIGLVNLPSKSTQIEISPAGNSLTQTNMVGRLAKTQEKVYKIANRAADVKRNALVEVAKAEMAYRELYKLVEASIGKEPSEAGKGWWTRSLLASVVDPDDPTKPGKAPKNCWNSKHFGTCRTDDYEWLDGCCYRSDMACDDDGTCAPRAMYQALTNGDLLMTVEKACDETPGCAFYTCWLVGTQIQCRVYAEGRLVIGSDGREMSNKVQQKSQVSSCKGCHGEPEQDRVARCGAKNKGVCTSLETMAERCSKVDLRIHTDLQYVLDSDVHQVNYNIYYTPDQLQCLGVKGYPELLGTGSIDFPITHSNITIKCPPNADFCTSSSTGIGSGWHWT